MTALLMHPNDEIFFTALQKEIIALLYEEGRIIYSQIPLWIDLDAFDIKDKAMIKKVQIGQLCVEEASVYCPVSVEYGDRQINSRLDLIHLHKGKAFTASQTASLKEKPVRQLKVFRLGLMQEQGPHVKSISKSVWCKIR